MSFVFRGTRGDIESGFPGFIPECRQVVFLGVFLMATSFRMYATCQQLQAQKQAHAAAASGLLGHSELRLHMPPSIAFATRGRLQGLILQLALLDREFDDLVIEEEINSLHVHKYKAAGPQRKVTSLMTFTIVA
ncbi:hypothetical protein MKX01_030377 [Papaver californicum]|nr:hypothetical protein MKX01_030377 [Papaver californicum]